MIAVYVRVSTEDQARKGFSLSDQLLECRKKAGEGEEIREYIDEAKSGEFMDRPALARLRQDTRDGLITKVVCMDPDRWSRKLLNQLIITEEIEKRAELVFVNGDYQDTPEGKLFYQMRGAISEFEKAKINERMSRGRRQKARQGKVVRDYGIYGYDYDAQSGGLLINPYEAKVVRLIFELFTGKDRSAQGINGIAIFLTDKGIPTKRGRGTGVWHRQVVRQMLMNRTYIGEFYQNRWNTEGMLGNRYRKAEDKISMTERPREEWILIPCPAIVDNRIFEYAQSLLKESRRRWAGKSRNKYLLSGLLRCGYCGNTMTGVKAKNWGRYEFMYTDVKGTAGSKNRGCGNRAKMERLDEGVWNCVAGWLGETGDIAEETEGEAPEAFEEAELKGIELRLEGVKRERKNLVRFLVHSEELGQSEAGEIHRKFGQLAEEEERLTSRREELLKASAGQEESVRRGNPLYEAAEHYLKKAPQKLELEDKRELIRLVAKEIHVFKDVVKIYGF